MQRIKKKKIITLMLALFLIGFGALLFFIDIDALIAVIGIQNVYLILFIVAATAGASFLTSASFYALFLSYAQAGLDPVLLGIVGGVGMAVGDSIFFFMSKSAGDVLYMNKNKVYKKIYQYVSRLPHWGVYIFTFLYAAFVPIPNDILMIILGVLRFRYIHIVPIIICGNITLLILIALGMYYIF